jgi:ribose 5-phosphate isomerase B
VSDLSDSEIHGIVQRVLRQAMGLSSQNVASLEVSDRAKPDEPVESAAGERKVVAIGADHGGFELKEMIKSDLPGMGFDVIDVGTHGKEAVDYPDFAHEVANLVSAGSAWRGIMVDGAGIGSCIVANKIPGVRAGMAYDYSSAVNSREHNDTNVLTLGAGLIGVNLARLVVQTWLKTPFGGGRHARRVDKIIAIERQYIKQGTSHECGPQDDGTNR